MQIIKKIILFSILINFLNSCSGLSDAGKVLRNEKTKTTDEFLVKKREPLILPPDFKKIPKPGSINKAADTNTKIDEILNIPTENQKSNASLSIENSIINQINK